MKQLKILVIGSSSFRWRMSRTLRDAGYKVSTAENVKAGIDFIKGHFTNLNAVLVDKQTPGQTPGKRVEDVIGFVRRYFTAKGLRVILTGDEIDDATKKFAVDAGADVAAEEEILEKLK